jgi:hypothetical protein
LWNFEQPNTRPELIQVALKSMTEAEIEQTDLVKSFENLDISSDITYHTPEGTFVFISDPLESQRLRGLFTRGTSISGPNYVPEQLMERWDLGIEIRAAFRVNAGVISSACMLTEPSRREKRFSNARSWLGSWHEKEAEMPNSEEDMVCELSRLSEEIRIREEEHQKERAEYERKEKALWAYRERICNQFGLDADRRESAALKIRSDQKSKEIMKYVGFQPTPEDLEHGNILSKVVDEHGNSVQAAFVATKRGSLVCGVLISRSEYSDDLQRWAEEVVYKRDLTPEMIDEQERERERRDKEWEERKRIENEKKAQEAAVRTEELKNRLGDSEAASIPSTVIDELVTLAINETSFQRETSPDRRPTFAPPIPFSENLQTALERLRAMRTQLEFEPGYGRLWAVWESPKLANGKCKGFDLRVGKDHDGEVLVSVRPGTGGWWTGPRLVAPSPVYNGWNKERWQKEYDQKVNGYILYSQLRDLGVAEIMKFSGSPEEVMRAGARIAGICCRCGRSLTDPTSMALGIGPECIQRVASQCKISVEELAHEFRAQKHEQVTFL